MALAKLNSSSLTAAARRVIEIERDALTNLANNIHHSFAAACETICHCTGKVIVTGMGKSGHIGNKIAATLASTGTPSFYMHPGEANHGDLGMLSNNDVLLAISNSGETAEVLSLLPVVKRLGVPIIGLTGNSQSTLASQASIHLDIAVQQEACPLGLAPTTSTTVTLVLGDAIAVSLLEARGFTSEDFALSHPGGSLGKKLLLQVGDIMLTGNDIPIVNETAGISDALMEVSSKGLGFTGVVNAHKQLLGVFTDGDLRRVLDQRIDLHNTPIAKVMTAGGITVKQTDMAVAALNIMEQRHISSLMVVDDSRQPIGAFNMHMLLRAGVV